MAARCDAVQQALIEHGGTQCGFCTPGIVVSAVALLEAQRSRPSDDEIRHAIAGNLCRCTGYDKIVEADAASGASHGKRPIHDRDRHPLRRRI